MDYQNEKSPNLAYVCLIVTIFAVFWKNHTVAKDICLLQNLAHLTIYIYKHKALMS